MANRSLSCYPTPFGNMVHLTDDRCIGLSLREYGEWAPGETLLLKQIIQPGDCIYDVGANIGFHARFFSHCVGQSGRVIAFEPQESMYRILGTNIVLAQHNNIEGIHCLVGSDTKVVKSAALTVKPGNYGAASYDLSQESGPATIPIMQLRLDDVPDQRCDLIKIDVEGMELSVLEGASNTLNMHKPIIFFEQNSEKNYLKIQALLNEQGYTCFWSVSPAFPSANMYGRSDDLFRGAHETNILAVPKNRLSEFDFLPHLIPVDKDRYLPPKLSTLPDAFLPQRQKILQSQVDAAKSLSASLQLS